MLKRPLSFDDIPLVLTVEELMPILSIGRNTAFKLVSSGQIRSIRAGKHIRILKNDLRQFLEDGGRLSGGTGTNSAWTDDAPAFTLEDDSCRVAKGGYDDAAR